MKKSVCLIIALMMLFAAACSEATVSDDSSDVNESTIDSYDDASRNSSSETESSETESSVPDETSDETSDESHNVSSEPYVFEPNSGADSWLICDHGAIFFDNWFHRVTTPFVNLYNNDETVEDAIRRDEGMVEMSDDEYSAWWHSETPDEYKFECHIHDPDEEVNDYWDGTDPEPVKNKNVVMFVRQFDVDKEEFLRFYYDRRYYYDLYHDPEVLFDWEYQDACNWYLDYYNKNREILEAKWILNNLSYDISQKYDKVINETYWLSTVQKIYELNVPREYVEERLEYWLTMYKKHNEKLHTGEVVISYKLDDVYNRSEEFMELIEKVNNGEIYPMELEDWFMDIHYN